MKHIATLSGMKQIERRPAAYEAPGVADAKSDFLNAVWTAWNNYTYAKKNKATGSTNTTGSGG